MTSSHHLLSHYNLAGLELPNRVVLAPMTRSRSGASRIPNELMAEYYAQRASAGLIITEATSINVSGIGWSENAGIYTEEMSNGWRPVIHAVHDKGGKIFLQLWHCGRASHTSFHPETGLPVAPSAIKINGDHIHTPIGKQPYETPRALELDELPALVEDYTKAAHFAKHAGFDGIEVHAANGYLLDTFLQSKTNHRTDVYGGNQENRFRLIREVLSAVRSVFPSNRVGIRFSPNGVFNDMGSPDFREDFLYYAGELNEFNLAYLHVMDGLAFGFHNLGEPLTLADFRKVFKNTLMGNCGYNQETAEAAIFAGNADLIAIGRPFISNPDLVERFKNNWPLAPDAPMDDWYTPKGAAGYTDYPVYAG